MVERDSTYFLLKPFSIPTNMIAFSLAEPGELYNRSGFRGKNDIFNLLGLNFLEGILSGHWEELSGCTCLDSEDRS